MKRNLTPLQIIGTIAAICLFFGISNFEIEGTTTDIRQLLAILAAAMVLWITTPIPIYLTGVLIPLTAWATGFVPFSTAFSGFSGTTFWFLFAALGLAGCIRESGIARRIALIMLYKVKPRFSHLILTVAVIMFLLGYVLPLAAARVALMITIIIPVVSLFDRHIRVNLGKAATLIIALLGAASAWQVLTGGMPGMLLWGSLGQAGHSVSWLDWALIMIVPTAVVFAVMYLVINKLYRPKNHEIHLHTENLEKDLDAMGGIGGVERRSLFILGTVIFFWLTEPVHGLGVELVGIVGVFLFVLPKIGTIDFDDFLKKAVPWPLLLFVGALMSLNAMAYSSGLGDYIGQNLISPLYSIADNPVSFILATWILNTVTAAAVLFVPSIPLFAPSIAAAAIVAGVNPVIGGLVYLSCFPQMLFYAAVPFFPIAYDSGTIEVRDWVKTGFFYWIAWPITHIACLYSWYQLLDNLGRLP